MLSFEDFKKEIVARCKKHSACEPEFKRILAADTIAQIHYET